jgi:phage I-like protein
MFWPRLCFARVWHAKHTLNVRSLARLAQQLGSVEVEADKPLPTRFRIFRAGPNPSDRGAEPFIFDAKAAASVMTAYQAQGNRMMIDLMHGATDDEAIRLRSDAADAMCWFDLELLNGELWGINAEWTPEGDRRVRAKLQRYLSPAFLHDKSMRIVELANVALVSRAGLCQATDVAALRARHRDPKTAALSAQLRSAIVSALSGRRMKSK